MIVEKGLVIREPWIDLILSGQKTWEMRSQAPSYRGWIGLIRKGSGCVSAIARLAEVGAPLSMAEMVATIDRHQIPERMIRSGEVAKWTTPWKLSDIRVLRRPVPYHHPNGAILLFTLDPEARAAIAAQLGGDQPAPRQAPPAVSIAPKAAPPAPVRAAEPREARLPTASATPGLLGEVEVTEGNLKNNHFYLRRFLDRFPEDLVGGRDRTPPRLAQVVAKGMSPTSTDICPTHRFFRDRSWTRAFFASADAEVDDVVQVHELGPSRYQVSLRKKARL